MISAMTRDAAGNLYVSAAGLAPASGSQIGSSQEVLIQRRGSSVLPGLPEAVAMAADQIGGTSARLNGSVNPNGRSAIYHFEYGPTAGLGSRTPDQAIPAIDT